MKKQKRCYIYTRVSTAIQVDGYSLDAQKDKLRKYAEYQDMTIVSEFSDEGFSGKNIKGRPEFSSMMEKIETGKDNVDFVLVFKLSRFGRNAADVLNSLQIMQDYGVNLICVEDGIDSSKDAGKLMISVLSAVAEIERENIRTQTMAGREQKAKEGKWNGGFAPYGYKLENGNLLIAEDEVEIIRIIYDRYIHTNSGINGVASYLNDNRYTKKLRQNNTIPGFSSSFVKSVLDNPVYMGKIAYGRRRTEKKIGTRNEMHIVEQAEFPIYEGCHEAIISETDWQLAQEKRKANAYKREKVHDTEHAHILSGLLKCPCCGKSLYGNIAKAHSKDKYTRYYYYCKNTLGATGHKCTFRINIEQTEMNRMVAAVISAMVKDTRFVSAIKKKIGTAIDTSEMEERIEALRGQLKQVIGTKTRLEHQMDNLDVTDPHYDKKISDLQRRYDEQYDKSETIEAQIEEWNSRLLSVRQEKISADNVYQLLLAFDHLYNTFCEADQKDFMRAFIERIDIYPEKPDNDCWIRNIVFNFPMPVKGKEIKTLPLEKQSTVETVTEERPLTEEQAELLMMHLAEEGFLKQGNAVSDKAETEIETTKLPQELEAARAKAVEMIAREGNITPENITELTAQQKTVVQKTLGYEDAQELITHLEEKGYITKAGKTKDSLKTAIQKGTLDLPLRFEGARAQIETLICHADTKPPVRDASRDVTVRLKKEKMASPEFLELWNKIKQKTTYRVKIDGYELIRRCVAVLKGMEQIPKAHIVTQTADIQIDNPGVMYIERGIKTAAVSGSYSSLPNLLVIISTRTLIKRATVYEILKQSGRLEDFLNNPQLFIEKVTEIILNVRHTLAIDGISYKKLYGEEYFVQEIFDNEDLIANLDRNAIPVEHSIYDYIVYDSTTVEKPFALALDDDPDVKMFFKLPDRFKIDTPIGSYNPDWAVYVEIDGMKKLYFVLETKGSTSLFDLRGNESMKIQCGKAHFRAIETGAKLLGPVKDWKDFKVQHV